MSQITKDELKVGVGDTGHVWAEIVAVLDHEDIPCDFCNHEGSTAERGTINADYVLKVGHGGATYICDYCLDPREWG